MSVSLDVSRKVVTGAVLMAILGTASIMPIDHVGPVSATTTAVVAPGGVSSGLALWLDASNPNGTGTLPAQDDPVTTWKDLSGSNRDATVNPRGVVQSNTAAVFESAPSGFDGKPALRFTRIDDNSGSVYEVLGLDIRATTRPDITVLAVYRPTTQVGNQAVWGADNLNWDRFFLSSFPNGSDNGLVALGPIPQIGGGNGAQVLNSGTTNFPKLMAIGYDGNVVGGVNEGEPNASFVYFNCALVRSFADTTDPSDAQTALSVGWDGDTSAFDGYIAEVIVYERVLTLPELDRVSGYLNSKYDLGTGCGETVCDLEGARTLSQGGWSNTSSSNPMSETWFDENVGDDLTIGGESRSVTLDSAANVRRFLPQSGTPSVLRNSLTNPTRTQVKNTLAGQATALTLNLALNPGMANALLLNGYTGTVTDLLDEVNAALNGTNSPSKSYLSILNHHSEYVNLSFPNGLDQVRLTCPTD